VVGQYQHASAGKVRYPERELPAKSKSWCPFLWRERDTGPDRKGQSSLSGDIVKIQAQEQEAVGTQAETGQKQSQNHDQNQEQEQD
jgi:hypothetical protein